MKAYPPIVKVIKFNNIDDFFDQVLHYGSPAKINLSNYIFRGHSFEDYELIPSALRPKNQERLFKMAEHFEPDDSEFTQTSAELELLRKFYKKSDLQALRIPEISFFRKDNSIKRENTTKFIPQSMHVIAGLAQHYGCYTRLLDWTNDINIALYFAIIGNVEKAIDPENEFMDIWCLSETNIGLLNIGKGNKSGELFLYRPQYNGNQNLAAQKGLFSIWYNDKYNKTTDNRSLEQIIDEAVNKDSLLEFFNTKEPIFYLFKLPKKYIKQLYNYLSDINCTASRLFPGYGGIAKEIEQDALFK